MRAGQLRNYVTIQQYTEAFDSNGELVKTWSTFNTVWASIEPLVGREYWSSRQINAEITGKIRMRYIANLTSKMQIVYSSKTYQIEAVIDPENRHIELVLLTKEIA